MRFPEIRTTAEDAVTGSHHALAAKEVHLVDTVTYKNLIPGETYTVSGLLIDKETGEPVKDAAGEDVTAQTEFSPESAEGSILLDFYFDGSHLAGHETVGFETLYYEEKELAVHADINDEDQTVRFPEIRTTAEDAVTGSHHGLAAKEVHLTDTVTYKHLIPGETYTVSGLLIDKETGEPVKDAAGEDVKAQTEFSPESTEGSILLDFYFDGSHLAGHEMVVFETLYYEEKELAVHADLEDENQTIIFPFVHTTAVDRMTQSHEATAQKRSEIIDTVDYSGLQPGQTYTVRGTLMDKKTGKELLADGKPVTGETSFIPEENAGSIQVRFVFDATGTEDFDSVVFEKLYQGEYLLASHEDLQDKGQTVSYHQPPVPETEKVVPKSPSTGDDFPLIPAAAAAICCGGALIAMAWVNLRKGKRH